MAAIQWSSVTDFDASLSAVNASAQTAILATVNTWLDVSTLDGEDGPQTFLARCYLAAHHGLGCLPGTSGIVIGETGGDGLGVTYAVPLIAQKTALGETKWGRRYADLMGSSLARTWVVL